MGQAIQYAKTADGVSIAFLTVGDGTPIVFASNIFGDAHCYRHLSGHHVRGVTDGLAARGWQVVRYDVRGMGASDRMVADLSLDARVADLEAVVASLGLDRLALAGVDHGAATALAYAARHPSGVSRLVLLSPWVSGAAALALPDRRIVSGMLASNDREWSVFTDVLGNVASAFEDVELGRELATAMRASTSPSGLAAYYRTSIAIDLTDAVTHVAAPTLVVHEPAFPFGSLELCESVAKGLRDARLVVVQERSIVGTAHEGYVATIDEFLRSGAVRATPAAAHAGPRQPPTTGGARLTTRQIHILALLANGLTNKDIAGELGIAVATVERHTANIYTKIGARGRVDATAYAIRHGLTRSLR